MTTETAAVAFDDVEAISAAASEEFGPWGPELHVTQELIDAFAQLSGDHQWIHVDVERAQRESPFGGPVAHGFLTLVLLPRLRPPSVAITGHRSAANYGAEMLRFVAPVPAGSTIHARVRILRAEQKPTGTLVTSEYDVRVVGAERPSLIYRMQILYQG